MSKLLFSRQFCKNCLLNSQQMVSKQQALNRMALMELKTPITCQFISSVGWVSQLLCFFGLSK